MESLPEKSPFPVHSFTSPCPSVRSVNSAPTPPLSSSSSCRSVSVFNPFDENLEERLRHSVYSPAFGADGPITVCPTCVFGGGHNTEVGRHPSRNRRRSIDTMSILFPTDIDIRAARRQERAKLNTELEAQAQNSLSEFFRVKLHEYYSPSSCSRSDLDAVSNYEEDGAVCERDDNTIESDMYCEQETQTILTIPTHFDLTKLIGHLHSYQEDEQSCNKCGDKDEIYSPASDYFPMDRFSSSSPLRSCGRSNQNEMRKMNHETNVNWCSNLDMEDELLSLNDDEECDNDAQNKSRSSSLGEDLPEDICVSPIPYSCSNTPLGATPARGSSSSSSKLSGAKLTSSPSPKNRVQRCPTSPIPHSFAQFDDPGDDVFESQNSHYLTSNNPNGVRFLSAASEEEADNFSEAASEHHRAQQGPAPANEENDDAAVLLLGAIDDPAVSFAGRLESTRQMSIEEDVAMLSSIRNDTLMVTTEDSGFIGSGGTRDQRFAPALSSTRIGAQFLGGLAADSGCSNTGVSLVTNLMNSQDAAGNSSQDSQYQRIGSGRSNTRNNYREPIAEVPSFNNTQNSFMLDEGSRDMLNRSSVNNEPLVLLEAPLDTTSAGIRDQFQDFGLISPMGAAGSLSESLKQQRYQMNHSPSNNLTPLPEPRTKLPRTSGTPDLMSFHVDTSQNISLGTKSYKRELFKDKRVPTSGISDLVSGNRNVHSNSTASCSEADGIHRGSKVEHEFGPMESNENTPQIKTISLCSTNAGLIPFADRTNANSDFSRKCEIVLADTSPLSDDQKFQHSGQQKSYSTSTCEPGKTKPVRKAARRGTQARGSLSDVLYDQWWDSRTNKQH